MDTVTTLPLCPPRLFAFPVPFACFGSIAYSPVITQWRLQCAPRKCLFQIVPYIILNLFSQNQHSLHAAQHKSEHGGFGGWGEMEWGSGRAAPLVDWPRGRSGVMIWQLGWILNPVPGPCSSNLGCLDLACYLAGPCPSSPIGLSGTYPGVRGHSLAP